AVSGQIEEIRLSIEMCSYLTDDLARKQAKQADTEIKAGRYRGPLHGIPWGAKDLIAKSGYPTTWARRFQRADYSDRCDGSGASGERSRPACVQARNRGIST